jgi:hypothetical protein
MYMCVYIYIYTYIYIYIYIYIFAYIYIYIYQAKPVWGAPKTFATTITEESGSTDTAPSDPVSTEKIVQADVSTNVRNWSQIAGKSVL